MASDFADVVYVFRFMNIQSPLLFVNSDKRLTEFNGGYADTTAFDMVDLKLLEGNKTTASEFASARCWRTGIVFPSVAVVTAIAIVTVVAQSLRAARKQPSKCSTK